MRIATVKATLFLLVAAPAFLFAASPGGAPVPLSDMHGTYAFTQALTDMMNDSLGGYEVLTPERIMLTLSGDGKTEGDVSVLAFNNKNYTFNGTYVFNKDDATLVFSRLSGKRIKVVERIFGKGAFDVVTSFFAGTGAPLTYANGEIMSSDGTVFFVKQ